MPFRYIRDGDYAQSCADSDCCPRSRAMTSNNAPPPPKISVTMVQENSDRSSKRHSIEIKGELERQVRVIDTPPHSSISCASSLDDVTMTESKMNRAVAAATKLESRDGIHQIVIRT
jgi:hypothetical protein